ncbi:MAG: AAA family ATPase [Planctomycetia bacterium]|nr:AAA family ATPase [Planctomycetia bacterium]
MSTSELVSQGSLLAAVLSDEGFFPSEPHSMEEAGLAVSLVESLVVKHLAVRGTVSGRGLAELVCLPFGIMEPLFGNLRTRQIIVHTGAAPFNDYFYALTEQGRDRAQAALEACAYTGAAPVPLSEYVLSVEAQTIRAEAPQRSRLEKAFGDISIDPQLFDSLGPAVNSGAGLFLYGAPGNGKSTLARRVTICFGQQIWLPQALIEDGQIIKLYDAVYHEVVESRESSIVKAAAHDRRWMKVRRPTVVVGGELTMDGLEIRHDPRSNTSEAPLQLKSNCGCLLIDDFGRQRIEPAELLNRWIIPLENRQDFLTLATGKKIKVPFEQLIIFSTNLEPSDLVDEAFLRRIPYKIHVNDPTEEEFQHLFELYAATMGCEYRADVVEHLLRTHYRTHGLPLRRCHPRDLLSQVRNYCVYNALPVEMRPEYFDRVVKSYFTAVLGGKSGPDGK